MFVELKRSSLPTGEWYLRQQGLEDWILVTLPEVIAGRINGDSAWFDAVREERGWRIKRFVMALAYEAPAAARAPRSPRAGPRLLRSVT